MSSQPGAGSQKILVSDFDGTMTANDFYELAVQSLLPPDTPDHWAEYRAGRITHFEALRRYFAAIRVSEESVWEVVKQMVLDADLSGAVASLRNAGWEIVIASAGCDWYIRRLLLEAGVTIELHANPGHFVPGRGLLMELPKASPFLSTELGINKAGIVQHYLSLGRTVAFGGDGFPDVAPARLVDSELRFARGDLAEVLQAENLAFNRYETWSDIATMILSRND